MPIASLKSVFSVSSEDSAYPASNLLCDSNKKWKCELPPPAASIHVILQFDRSTQITGLDIGNEHSAMIEVFVGKNGWSEDKYQQILLGTQFMSHPESRSSISPHRVKCFGRGDLDATVREQKWDLIKIVCQQMFNKHVQYGLSFVKIHRTNDETDKKEKEIEKSKESVVTTNSGSFLNLLANNVATKFKIRENTPESDEDAASGGGSLLFQKWKQSKKHDDDDMAGVKPMNVSAASAIRDAATSTQKLEKFTTVKPKTDNTPRSSSKSKEKNESKPRDRNRESLLYDDDDVNTSIPKLEKIIDKDNERIRQQQEEFRAKKKPTATSSSSASASASSSSRSEKKMEASAQKFKAFLSDDPASTPPRNKPTSTVNDNDRTLPTSTSKATKIDELPKTPVQTNKRPSSAHSSTEEHSAKKIRSSASVKAKELQYKPFGKLLEGVVIAISGIQNPERADIRDRAQKMGARYRPDWDGTCTHLICAFRNTPKYNEVKKLGKGKIVKRDWIPECSKQKRRLPWRRYALDPAETTLPESEDEIHDLASKPMGKIDFNATANNNDDDSASQEVLKMYELNVSKSPSNHESESDTEMESSLAVNLSQPDSIRSYDVPNIYDVSTDEETSNK